MLVAEACEGMARLVSWQGGEVDMTPWVIARLQAWYVHDRITVEELEQAVDEALRGGVDRHLA